MGLANDPAIREAYMGLSHRRSTTMNAQRLLRIRRLPLRRRCIPVFGRRRGVAGLSHRARAVPGAGSARRRIPPDRADHRRRRPPADRILRLRAPIARPIHRKRVYRLQQGLRRHLGTLEDIRRQDQSGGAQQRLPSGRAAGGAFVPRLLLHRDRARFRASFVIAGSGEAPEGRGNYRDHIVRLGDTTAAGIREKARFVLGEMERRMAALGFTWRETTATQIYTVHDIHPFLADEIIRRGAARSGCHLALQPPAGGRSRIRDGLPRRLESSGSHEGQEFPISPA